MTRSAYDAHEGQRKALDTPAWARSAPVRRAPTNLRPRGFLARLVRFLGV